MHLTASSVAASGGMSELGPVRRWHLERPLRLLFDPCHLRAKPAQLPHHQDSYERRGGQEHDSFLLVSAIPREFRLQCCAALTWGWVGGSISERGENSGLPGNGVIQIAPRGLVYIRIPLMPLDRREDDHSKACVMCKTESAAMTPAPRQWDAWHC